MKEITLTINGQQVKGKEGDTVLQICRANGIDVPTLCHLDGLADIGACRICVVEIEKERRPVPSCTYPARDGLVVKTDTERLEKYRRQIIELLFTERNHYCMFCEQSGDCELQNLAYRYQMDHVRYPYAFPPLTVDALNDNLVIDHNRCVLCGRCVRACNEVVGLHTLDFAKRGWKTSVSADLDQPIGESTCISCGACMQACPTGAIFSKLSLYKGKEQDCQQTTTACSMCGVGCELKVMHKDNNLVKIESPMLDNVRGALCERGRFGLLRNGHKRVTAPMVRGKKGKLEECTLDQALDYITEKLAGIKDGFAGIASTRYPAETLSQFKKLVEKRQAYMDTLDGRYYRLLKSGLGRYNGKGLEIEAPIEEILNAECILVAGADPLKSHPVVGSLILRAMHQNQAKVIVVNPVRDVFPLWSEVWLKPGAGSEGLVFEAMLQVIGASNSKGWKDAAASADSLEAISQTTGVPADCIEEAAVMFSKAERAVIIYDEELLSNSGAAPVASLLKLAEITGNKVGDKLRVISLKPNANSRGAWELGLAAGDIPKDKLRAAYVLLADEGDNAGELVNQLKGLDLLVVQATYQSPLTEMAHVVLPSTEWSERQGKYVSMDGREAEIQPVLKMKDGMLTDNEILTKLSRKMGGKHG